MITAELVPLLADLLMGAAYADERLHGREALTIPKLEAIKAQYSTRTAEFLGKASDESQYMAACLTVI